MKICIYQLTQSHTRGELSEPNSTQRLLQSTEKDKLYILQFYLLYYYICSFLLIPYPYNLNDIKHITLLSKIIIVVINIEICFIYYVITM